MELPLKRKRKLKRINSSLRYTKKVDFVAKLFSKELVLKVFSFLSLKDLMECAVVNVQWSSIVNDEMLWKPLFMKRFQSIKMPHRSLYEQQLRRYEGSWKRKYKVHHNWIIGNCHIFDFTNVFANNSDLDTRYHLQLHDDTIYIANTQSSVIETWQCESLEGLCIRKSQLQSMELTSYPDVYITFLKVITENLYLIAGYSNGGFTLWKINNGVEEVVNFFPSELDNVDPVVNISMNDPIITVNTASQKLYIFHLSSCAKLDMIHYLESFFCLLPLTVDIQKHQTRQWKVLICCGISGADHCIWLMEIVLSSQCILSTRQGYTFLPQAIESRATSTHQSTSSHITIMAFSPPYLITAHPNNTIKQYEIIDNPDGTDTQSSELNLSFMQTLYGHTYQVSSLAMKGSKLVSGDRSAIKIWDLLAKKGSCQVSLYTFPDQSIMNELPDATIENIEFDEDKIIAIVRSETAGRSLRCWSFKE